MLPGKRKNNNNNATVYPSNTGRRRAKHVTCPRMLVLPSARFAAPSPVSRGVCSRGATAGSIAWCPALLVRTKCHVGSRAREGHWRRSPRNGGAQITEPEVYASRWRGRIRNLQHFEQKLLWTWSMDDSLIFDFSLWHAHGIQQRLVEGLVYGIRTGQFDRFDCLTWQSFRFTEPLGSGWCLIV